MDSLKHLQEPYRRPIQLQLPVLAYESHLGVWEERMDNILAYAAVRGYIERSSLIGKYNNEQRLASMYCLTLLESSISENILVGIWTLVGLPQAPHDLFTWAKHLVEAVQMVKKHGSLAGFPNLWNAVQGRNHYHNIHSLVRELQLAPKQYYTRTDFSRFILVAALLVKQYFPACRSRVVEEFIQKTLWPGFKEPQLGEQDWVRMKNDLNKVI